MANVFSKNAYNILSLETDATFKDINRKAREINQLSKIGETEIDGSFSFLVPNREESDINEALDNLNSPKKRLREYFFWFDNNDEIDEKFVKLLKDNKIDEAIHFLENNAEGSTIEELFKKKNLAIIQTILLLNNDSTYLKESINYWKEILDSDKYWKSFEKIYEANDEADIETELIENFRLEVPNFLADAYLDASDKDNSIFTEFRSVFKVKGSSVDKKIIAPALNSIAHEIEILEKQDVGADNVFSQQEISEIGSAVKNIRRQLAKLSEMELDEDSEVKVYRDKAAEAIRKVVIDLNNTLDETKKAIQLLEVGYEICGTTALRQKLKNDLDDLKEIQSSNEIYGPISELMGKNKTNEALALIDQYLLSSDIAEGVKEGLIKFKQTIEDRIKVHGKPIKSAPSLFTIWGCGSKIYGDVLYFTLLFIPIFPLARYSLNDNNDETFTFYGKLELSSGQKAWKYIGIILFVIFIISIISSSDDTTYDTNTGSNTNPNTTQITPASSCNTATANSLKPDVSDKMELENLQTSLESSSVNNYSPQYQIDEYNSELAKYKKLQKSYNSRVDKYNSYIDKKCK